MKKCRVCRRPNIPKNSRRLACKACYNRLYYRNVYKVAGLVAGAIVGAGAALAEIRQRNGGGKT